VARESRTEGANRRWLQRSCSAFSSGLPLSRDDDQYHNDDEYDGNGNRGRSLVDLKRPYQIRVSLNIRIHQFRSGLTLKGNHAERQNSATPG